MNHQSGKKVQVNLLLLVFDGIENEIFEMATRLKNNTISKSHSNLVYFVNNGCNDKSLQYKLLLELHHVYKFGDTKMMLSRLEDDSKSFLNALLLLHYNPKYVEKLCHRNKNIKHELTDVRCNYEYRDTLQKNCCISIR